MHERLAHLLASYAGIDPPRWAVEARVRERCQALGLDDGERYVERVQADAGELGRLVELLRVGETRFFRHRAQLEAVETRVLPTLTPPVLVWSAGCATGEEAWTLAMMLAERGLDFSLTASDLSTTAIARARKGAYPAARVDQEVPPPLVAKYFRRIGDELVLNDRLRPHVQFLAQNLSSPREARGFDLVACRNVLIYFDDAARAQVVARLVRSLAPRGWLLVGYSETLRDCAELSGEAHAVYRKLEPERVRLAPPLPIAPAPPPLQRPASLPALSKPIPPPRPLTPFARPPAHAAPVTHPLRTVALRGDYLDGRRLAGELKPLVGATPAVLDLDGASFLGDEAARVLKRAVEASPHLQLKATKSSVRRWLQRHGIRLR